MLKRKYGRTDLETSALGFGTMEMHWLHEKSAYQMLNEVLDLGINYIDTSPEYPMAEEYIGNAIANRRDEYILATKCGDNLKGQGPVYIYDRKTIMENVEESLRRMKTDHLDVLQLHALIPEDLPGRREDEAIKVLEELKASGKVGHIGVTICNKNHKCYGYPATYGYNSILRFASWPEIEVVQLVYGGFTRISENVIQKAYDDFGTAIVARGIVKKYYSLFDSSGSMQPVVPGVVYNFGTVYDQRIEISRVNELFEEGETLTDFLTRYAISHPALSVCLTGTRNIKHLRANVKAAERGPLSPEIYAEAKRRLNYAGAIPGPTDLKTDW